MSLYRQPNEWSCGPFALKHALLTLGRLVSEDRIGEAAHTHWWSGTDELRLAKAARKFDVELEHERTRSSDKARRLLTDYLKEGYPILLCVDDWGHWITAVAYEAGRFVIVDSDDDQVVAAMSWKQLERRIRYYDVDYDEDDPPTLYDLHPVIPQFRIKARARFSLSRVRRLRRPENRQLAAYWNTYVEDLLEICRPHSRAMNQPLSMAEFLRRHQSGLMERLTYWHGSVDNKSMERLLNNYRFVADTYGLVITKADQKRALVDLSMLLAMTASAQTPVADSMYGFKRK